MWTPNPATIVTAEAKAAAARQTLMASYKAAFDGHLDAVAQERQYDSRLTIVAYAASQHPQWSAEAQAFILWRDAALVSMFDQLAAAEAGGEVPTVEAFIAALPVIDWPTVDL